MTVVQLNNLKVPLILLGLTFLSYLFYNYGKNVQFDEFFIEPRNILTQQTPNEKEDRIQKLLDTSIGNLPGTWGVYLKDLKTGATYEVNSDQTFGSASIYKLAVMYKTYDSINSGELSKDTILSNEKITLDKRITGGEDEINTPQNIGTSEVVSLNIENALEAMITISDNYSTLLLADRLGWKNMDTFLKENNIPSFNLVGENSPNTTAKDIGTLLEKIYTNTAINALSSKEMQKLLLNQKFNDRIPKYLPSNIKVAHKTGELETIRHDAGIVYGNNSHYIFVFLSSSSDQEKAAENIALMSKTFFEALEDPDFLK